MTTIDHSLHDHPTTKAAREKCRVHSSLAQLSRYPEPQRHGSIYRGEDGLWQRLALKTPDVEIGDLVAGLVVTGLGSGTHDNAPALRFDLEDPDGFGGGRLVLTPDLTVHVNRPFDPDNEPLEIDLDVVLYEEDGPDDTARMVNYLLGILDGTPVKAKVLTMTGPGGGHPIVRFSGARKDVTEVVKRYDPDGWEDLLISNEVEPQTPRSNFRSWQQKRIEQALNGATWKPVRLNYSPDVTHRTIFGQEVRDGWMLVALGKGTHYVGRELMKALIEQYPHLLDLPEDFQP